MRCVALANLIQQAYVMFANGRFNPSLPVPLEGAPGWLTSERYEIDAKVEEAATLDMMRGPLLQALLEERFKLKVHRETRGEMSIYVLSLGKSGFKLHELDEGACATNPCDDVRLAKSPEGSAASLTLIASGLTLDTFSSWVPPFVGLDRPVINRTGIPGRFSFHLDFSPQAGDVPNEFTGPSIFTAIQQQLGLKLEPGKAPAEFLIVDHVERPSDN